MNFLSVVSDLNKLREFVKIRNEKVSIKMSDFIKNNEKFFIKKYDGINGGTILHALSMGSKEFENYNTMICNFSEIIEDTIAYFTEANHKNEFFEILNLKSKPAEIKDKSNNTPLGIAHLHNNKRMQVLLSMNKSMSPGKMNISHRTMSPGKMNKGGKRKTKKSRFPKKKKSVKRRRK